MDLYCPKCGEPWEIDSLHDEAAARQNDLPEAIEYAVLFRKVQRDFQTRGCEAMESFGARHSEPSESTDRTFGLTRQDAASALYDLLGDDIDGAAAMLEDLGF